MSKKEFDSGFDGPTHYGTAKKLPQYVAALSGMNFIFLF